MFTIIELAKGGRRRQAVQLKKKGRRRADPKKEGTPQNIYVAWIKAEIEQEEACLELPFTLMLLLSFAALSIAYIGQDTISLLESSINTDIKENANFAWAYNYGHKSIQDVNSYADFWSWTRLGFLPLIISPGGWPYSESLSAAVPEFDGLPVYNTSALWSKRPFPDFRQPSPIRNDYLRFNRIIGGIRFRQQAAVSASFDNCNYPGQASIFRDYIGKACIASRASGDEELDPDLYSTELFDTPDREQWLLSEVHPYETLVQHLIDMEDGCASADVGNRTCLCQWCATQRPNHPWVNEMTTRIEISFMSYNAQYGIHCLATVNFYFNRAGHIHKRINMRSSWAGIEVRDTGTMFVFLTAGFVWAFANIYVFRTEGLEIVGVVRRTGKRWYLSITEDYLGFWNCVDWTSVAIALGICAMFASLMQQTYAVNDMLSAFAVSSAGGTLPRAQYQEEILAYYNEMIELFSRERTLRFWLCIYPIVLMMRLFKSFAAQPRLAVVTETFKNAASNMMHFFIVFSSVYFCMSVNAVLFFGQDDINFSRLDWALFSVWRAMLGDWDWDGMRTIGREKAFIWFSLFMLVVVVILMNILISILMESYAAVKSAADNADSLFRQVLNMMRRARETRQGRRVKLNDVQEALLQDAAGVEQDMLNHRRLLLPIFRVVLDTSDGSSIGLTFDRSGNHVLVKSIVPNGHAEKHNGSHPLYEIRAGDVVVEVNDTKGEVEAILAELAKHKVLKIRLRRSHLEPGTPQPMARKPTAASLRSMSTRSLLARAEPAFLMDMVEGIPETQAKRTLNNSKDAHNKNNAVEFSPDLLQDSMDKLVARVSNSMMCAGFLRLKLQEYEKDEEARVAALEKDHHKKDSAKRTPEGARNGITEVRMITQQRSAELSEDVATVLGEEMSALERRQKEQQRAMVHSQESLQGLRQTVYKLNVTCEEVWGLSRRCVARTGAKEAIIVPAREAAIDDPSVARAKLVAKRAGEGAEDALLHDHRHGLPVDGSGAASSFARRGL